MIGAIIGIIAALVSAGGAVYSAQQQRKTADYRAKLAEEAGEEVRAGTELEVARHRERIEKLRGRQRAAYAKSGVKMEGSPLEVLADTQAQADLDEMIIKHGGQVRAGAYEREGMFERRAGRSAETAGYIGAGTSLLAGASKAYGGYYDRNPKT